MNPCVRIWIAFVLLILVATGAHGTDFRIRYAEPAIFRTKTGATVAAAQFTTQQQVLRLEAYGQQFDLELTPNGRLLRAMPAKRRLALEKYPLLRGQISGIPGSWVRITRVGDQLFGAFWDGTELYTLSPAAVARRFAVAPLANANGNGTVVYRLSDTDSVLGLRFDRSVPSGKAAAQALQYQALVAELQTNSSLPQEQIELAVIGDHEFYTAHPVDTEGALLARMNIVDGIFSEQVGVTLVVPELRVFRTSAQPFNTNAAETLLQQLGNYRSTVPEIASRGLAHLFTGRDIRDSGDNIVGIAYIDALCDTRFGVGITEGNLDLTTSALTAAHEIGHNFGAPHDGEASCASAPTGFLMEPFINGSSTFSQCSLGRMRPSIDAAACIMRSSVGDASLEGTATSVSGFAGEALVWPIDVTSVGTAPVRDVTVTIPIPGSVTIDSATVPGGACATGGEAVTCTLGLLDQDTSRRIEVRLRANAAMSYDSTVRVSGSNDGDASNNVATVHFQIIEIGPFMDAALVPSALPTHVETGDSFDVPLTVTTNGYPMADATLRFTTQLDVVSVSAPGTCVPMDPYTCNLGDLPANASIPVVLRLRASKSGPFNVNLFLSVVNDMFDTNNRLVFSAQAEKHGDAAVQLGSQQLTSAVNRRTAFPEITVTGVNTVDDVLVRIGMPVTVYAESLELDGDGGFCQVNDLEVLCNLGTVAAGTSRHINFDIAGSRGGTFVSDVTLTSALDVNQGNNKTSVSLRFEGSTGGGGGGGAGGGGGGGALEWTSLACLIAGLARRRRTPGDPAT